MIKDYLEEMKGYNSLTNRVIDYYEEQANNYDSVDDLIKDMEDLQRYGCVSGMIGDLIYYDDTNQFFDDYKDEINDLLSETLDGTGLSMEELFGDKYDKEDPLNLDYSNKNLLAWFGFEETSSRIYENLLELLKNKDTEYAYE